MLKLAPRPSQPARPIPYGPANLWDMINFSLSDFLLAYKILIQERDEAAKNEQRVIDKHSGDMLRNIEWARATLGRVSSDEMKSRLALALKCFRTDGEVYGTLAYELSHILRLLEDRIRVESFFRYDMGKANLLREVPEQWGQTLASFYMTDDLITEIRAGVDCFALGYFTASIFHMMRVAEVGLRALAKERGVVLPKDKPIEYGNWQEILREVDKKVKEIGGTMPAGQAKDRALAFYNDALICLNALKDIFRNQTMHVRYVFNEPEALRAMRMTNDFMEKLGWEIFDEMEGPIDWEAAVKTPPPRDEA